MTDLIWVYLDDIKTQPDGMMMARYFEAIEGWPVKTLPAREFAKKYSRILPD